MKGMNRWATASIFHSTPNTREFVVEPANIPYVVTLYGFTYLDLTHRVFGVKVTHDTITDRVLIADSREFTTLRDISEWVNQSKTFRCFAGKEFASDGLKNVYQMINGAPYNLHLSVVESIDEPGIILYINTMISDGRLYASESSVEYKTIISAIDVTAPMLMALFPVVDSLHKRKRKPADNNRSVFHKMYEQREQGKVSSNGFVG
jgi:hypothetical protein